MIKDFPTNKAYNLAGLLEFQFLRSDGVASFPPVIDSKITEPLGLNYSAAWLKGYATAYTLKFTEVQENSEQGKYYKQTITGFVPGDQLELIQLMANMDGNHFVLQIRDASKQNRLVGGLGFPMLFSSNYDSGANRSDGKGYQFTFYAEALTRAPVYL